MRGREEEAFDCHTVVRYENYLQSQVEPDDSVANVGRILAFQIPGIQELRRFSLGKIGLGGPVPDTSRTTF